MNREIKFRGKGYSEWFYGYVQEYHEKFCKRICVCPVSIRTWKDALMYEVKEETIGQFTGHTDKNGKEIYEDDIVRVPALDPFGLTIDDVLTTAIVSFYRGSFIVKHNGGNHIIDLRCLEDDEIEVIGNIHDNSNYLGEQPCETKQ